MKIPICHNITGAAGVKPLFVPTTTWFAFCWTVMQLQQFLKFDDPKPRHLAMIRKYSQSTQKRKSPSSSTTTSSSSSSSSTTTTQMKLMYHIWSYMIIYVIHVTFPYKTLDPRSSFIVLETPNIKPRLWAVSRGSRGRTRAATRTLVSSAAPGLVMLNFQRRSHPKWMFPKIVVPQNHPF